MKRFANSTTSFNISKRLLLLLVCISTWTFSLSQIVTIDGLKYFLYSNTYEADVASGNTWSGELILPSEVEFEGQTYTVKGISCVAFMDSEALTMIRIPATIKEITPYIYSEQYGRTMVSPWNKNPFVKCLKLRSIEVDEENPAMCSVDGVLLSKDETQLYAYPAGKKQESYTVPTKVATIGQGAFAYNHYISSLTMHNSVTSINGGAICSNCINLKHVKLSENISLLDSWSFEKCENLFFLDIPESVTLLGGRVFDGSGIKTLVIRGTFPEGVSEEFFYGIDTETVLYVQRSEIEKFKRAFSGTVLPLDEYTGIANTSITKTSSTNNIFDLQGRRLSGKPAKGMYIQGGKKYVVK